MQKHIKRFKKRLKDTLIRLTNDGYSEKIAKDMIAIVLYENKINISNGKLLDASLQLENLK
jgi:hypothetical protein